MTLITNLFEIVKLIKSDFKVFPYYKGNNKKLILYALIGRFDTLTYLFWWRLSSIRNPVWPLAKLMHIRLSRKYGVTLPPRQELVNH